jgi:hypothetical protein
MNEMTATMWATPRGHVVLQPSHLLTLRENFRPTWTGLPIGSTRRTAVSVTACDPSRQLVHGFLTYLWMAAPAVLAGDKRLAGLMGTGQRGVVSRPISEDEAAAVYKAVAGLIRVDLTLHARTAIQDSDVRDARQCGILLVLADARAAESEVRV